MKLWLLPLTLVSVLSYAECAVPKRKDLITIMGLSHYTGCIDGFILMHELGIYKKPENMTKQQVMQMMKENCAKKSLIYRDEMGENDPSMKNKDLYGN